MLNCPEMKNRKESVGLTVFVLLMTLCLTSCHVKREPEKGPFKLGTPGTFQVIFQSGKNQLQREQISSPLEAGAVLQSGDSLISGGEILLMDQQGSWLQINQGSQIQYSGSQGGFFLHQGSIHLLSEKIIHLGTEDFQLEIQGEMQLNIQSLAVDLLVQEGRLRFLPGGISIQDLDAGILKQWPSLISRWESLQTYLAPGRTYHWENRDFRDVSRSVSSLFYLTEEKKPPKEAEEALRILEEFPRPEGLSLGSTDSISAKKDFILEALNQSPVIFQSISTEPEETSIAVGPFKGQGKIEIPLSQGGRLDLNLKLRGYENLTRSIEAGETSSELLISMQRKSKQNYSIEVDPPEARIYVNDLFAGKGRLVLNQMPGEVIRLRMELEGFNQQKLTLEDIGIYPDNIKVELNKTLQGRYLVSYQNLIGLAYDRGTFLVADRRGQLTSVRAKGGLRPWAVQTSNSPNDWSSPVVINRLVYFSGRKTLAVYDPSLREVIGVFPLNYRSLHQYGRRISHLGQQIVLPTADSLIFLSPDLSETLRVVDVPGGSLMTPLSYNNRLYVVSNDGRIYRFNSQGEIENTGYSHAFSTLGMTIAVQDNRGYFADREGLVVCFNLETLEVLWETALPQKNQQVFRDLQLDGEFLYLYSEGHLYQFHSIRGDFLKQWEEDFLTRPAINEGIIYGSSQADSFNLTEVDSGERILGLSLNSPPSSPVLSVDGYAAMGLSNGRLLIVNEPDQDWKPPEE